MLPFESIAVNAKRRPSSSTVGLVKAMRNLLSAWNVTKDSWQDAKMSAFEERYIEMLDQDTRQAVETMARMAGLIDQIRRECSDRDSL